MFDHKELLVLKKKSVLIVEDDDILRKNITEIFKNFFHQVYESKNGQLGFNSYRRYNPDVIFSDINMPVLNGIDFLKKIREEDNNVLLAIISAHSDKDHLLEAVKLKLEDYLIKPINEHNLYSVLLNIAKQVEKLELKEINLTDKILYSPKNLLIKERNLIYKLTPKENELLILLLKNRGSIVSYEQIERAIWYGEYMSISAVRTIVRDLRKKGVGNLIKNISKQGYMLIKYS